MQAVINYRIAGNFRRVKFSDIQIISKNILSELIYHGTSKVSKWSDNTYLPDVVNGPLAKEMPSSAIAAANSSIAKAMEIHQQKQATW